MARKSKSRSGWLAGSAPRVVLTLLTVALAAFIALNTVSRLAYAAGELSVSVYNLAGEPLNAYNLVVDSNINGMSTASPSAATVIVRFCNTGDTDLTNVVGCIGDYNSTTPANSTIGVYPPRSTSDTDFSTQHPALMDITPTTYRFTHIGGALGTADGARYIGTLAAGECRYQYWHFTYPLCEGNLNPPCRATDPDADGTWGDSVKPQDDLWLTFDTWATSDQYPLASGVPNASWKMTLRNEISAMANKIEPNPDGTWFNTDPNTIKPGGVITTNGILYEFGNINQGFDNDGDMVPDYNAWAQPVGNADFDPSCFRLIRTTGYLDISRSSGQPNLILPFTDKLYFTDLPSDNTGVRGYVHYTFLALGGPCNTGLSPYQEVASGRDNEKFNADYGAGPDPLPTPLSEVTVSKNGPTSVALNTTYTYNIPFANEGDSEVGISLSSGWGVNMPMGIVDRVPVGLEYVCGSASATLNYAGTYKTLFSSDGVTWKESTAANNSDVFSGCPGTNPQSTASSPIYIRWELNDPLPAKTSPTNTSTGTATFQAKAPTTYMTSGGSPIVTNEACAQLATAGVSLACDSTTTMIEGTNSIGDLVWKDYDGDGSQDGGINEPGINGVTVKLYWDENANGVLDAGETQLSAVDSKGATITDGLLDITSGTFAGYNTNASGRLDVNGDGLYDTNDDGAALIGGFNTGTNAVVLYNVIDGYVDVSGTGTIGTEDDATLSGNYGFAYLPDASYIVQVVTTDSDIPTGYAPTSPKQYAVTLSGGTTNNRTSDFGFGPALVVNKYLTSSNPAYEGDQVTFNIDLTNKLPGDGTSSGFCQYTVWATANGSYSAVWQNIPGAYSSADGPDGNYAYHTPGTNAESISATGFNLGPQAGNITKVEAIYSMYVSGSFADDHLSAQYWNGASERNSGDISPLTVFDAYIGQSKQHLYTWDVTSLDTFTWSMFSGSTLQVGWYLKKSVSGDAWVYMDAMGFRITTDKNCGGADTTIATLPLTDTYDADLLQFVSASPAQTTQSTSGLSPDTIGTITWANLGPLYAGGTKTVHVTFKTLDPGASAASTTNTGSVTGAKFSSGSKVNDDDDTADVTINPAGSIAGTVWSEGLGGTDGWVGTTGYESLGSTDFGIPGATVTLYACYKDGAILNTGISTNKACEGGSQNGGTWTSVGTATTDSNGYYKFTGLRMGFYYVTVSGAGGTQSAEAGASETDQNPNGTPPTGHNCGTCGSQWGDSTQDLNQSFFNPVGTLSGSALTSPSEDIIDVNFGYQGVPARIYGKVYTDSNGDGDQDSGEANLGSVSVRLCSDATCTTVLQTTTTATDGTYGFSVASPSGSYYVQVNNGSPVAGTIQTDDPDSSGTCSGAGCDNRTNAITLSSGQGKGSYDFGYQPTGSYTIGDAVYRDWDGDGTKDSGEENIPNITVWLYEDEDNDGVIDSGVDALIATDVTDANGYSFPNLPTGGNYIVVVDTADADFPTDHTQTGDPDGSCPGSACDSRSTSAAISGTDDLDNDFGYRPFGTVSIGDRVWADNDADGIQDSYEAGIGNVTVYLYQDEDGDGVLDPEDALIIDTTTTVNYQVVDGCIDVDGDGSSCTDAADDFTGGTGLEGVKVYDGRLDMDGDGIVVYKVIDGYIDVDRDNTTSGDTGDYGYLYGKRIINGRLDLSGNGSVGAEDNSATYGTYLGYTVIDGYVDINGTGTPPDTNDDNDYAIPDEGDDGTYLTYAVIDGKLDMNGSGSVTTADDSSKLVGMYQFTELPAGSYIVQIPDSNFDQSTDALYALQQTNIQASTENQHAATLSTGQSYTSADFGYVDGAIGDLIWQDNNGNGSWDTGEPGIAGVTVWLYVDEDNDGEYDSGSDTYLATTTTDADGIYRFTGLPASATDKPYLVVIDPAELTSGDLAGFTLTYDPDGPTWTAPGPATYPPCGTGTGYDKCNSVASVPLDLGQADYGQDFGYKPLGVIGDTLWINPDSDSVQDPGEAGIAYVTVRLCSDAACTGVIQTTQTDGDGKYSFGGLADGTYYVKVDSTDTDLTTLGVTQNYGGGSGTSTVVISGGVVTSIDGSGCSGCDLNVDFGYNYTPGSNSLAGTVFYDAGDNGGTYISGTDTPYKNILVYLWKRVNCGLGNVCDDIIDGVNNDQYGLVAQTVTNDSGAYSFSSLADATYRVVVDSSDPTLAMLNRKSEPVDDNSGSPTTPPTMYSAGTGAACTSCNGYYQIALSSDTVSQYDFGFYALVDYGDLLDANYSTVSGSEGPGHVLNNATYTGIYLGASADSEVNGQPSADATGDGADENGVTLVSQQAWLPGATVDLSVIVRDTTDAITSDYGYLVAFFDWNGDGDFADAGEMVNYGSQTGTTSGQTHNLTVDVPASADFGSTLDARFRLYDSRLLTSYGPTGLAVNGEVEDYQWKFGSIGDTIWMDLDRDGYQDVGEPGLPNVTVNLYSDPNGDGNTADGTLLATTYTDGDGLYRFETLVAGNYVAQVDTTTLPNGGTNISNTYDPDQPAGGDSSSGALALAAGQKISTADFGYAPSSTYAAVGDFIWSDADNDGIQDAGEPGIAGVTVALKDASGATIATATTDASGHYLFTNVNPGEYVVDVTDTGNKLSGYALKVGPQSSTDPTAPISVKAGDVYLQADFGYYNSSLGSISNQVWLDLDGDGLYESATETALSGIRVSLVQDSDGDGVRDPGEPIIATAVTGASGTYAFTGLLLDDGDGDADYLVLIGDENVTLRDYIKTTGTSQTADNYSKTEPYVVALNGTTTSNTTADFGYRYPLDVTGMIGDRVWFDLDGDQAQDAEEAGIPGVTVYLCASSPCSSGNALRTATTDANGNYYFTSLAAGAYYVAADTSTLPGGAAIYTNTFDDDGDYDSDSGAIALAAGQTYLDADFGYQYSGATYSIGDLVWRDDNANGRQDETGTGIAGVTLALYRDNNSDGRLDSGDTLLATDVTDSSGIYGFAGLPNGNYLVDVTDEYGALAGYRQTAGADPWAVTLNSANNMAIDFGYVRDPDTASIGDAVWYDEDSDGVQDPTEKGIPGVTVYLYKDTDNDGTPDTQVGSAVTGHDGTYRFLNLEPGVYDVRVNTSSTPLTGLTQTGDPDETGTCTTCNSQTNPIYLSEGEVYRTADFGYQGLGYSIGDFVWSDADQDGIQDPGEQGFSGVTVELLDRNGTVVGTTTTTVYGYYRFTGIATAGAYQVRVADSNFAASTDPLYGYAVTAGPESQGKNTSNFYVVNATTPSVDEVDFGYYQAGLGSIGDFVWLDIDKDGNADSGEPGIRGIYVDLIWDQNENGVWDSGEPVLATDISDADGYYQFSGLDFDDGTGSNFNYLVRAEDRDGLLEGMTLTTVGFYAVTLSSGTTSVQTADFGYDDPTIGDYVWHDVDSDGVQDAGESGLQGVTVLLYDDIDGDGVIDPGVDNLKMTRVTDEDGYYYFGDLPFGEEYIIKLDDGNFGSGDALEGFVTTDQNAGGNDELDSDPASGISSGVQIAIRTPALSTKDFTFDFGLEVTTNPRSIGNLVWSDTNADGYKDAGESGLDGVTLVLYRDLDGDGALDADDPVVGKTATSDGGAYSFTNLAPDTYIVQVTDENYVLKGYNWTNGTDNTDDHSQVTTYAVNATSGNIVYADFGFYQNPGSPTSVEMADFSVTLADEGVLIEWETATELDNLGFNVYRAESAGGPRTRLNKELIPAQEPGSVWGASYQFVDSTVISDTQYYYWLEDVDIHGVATLHGPVSAGEAMSTTAVELRSLRASGGTWRGLMLATVLLVSLFYVIALRALRARRAWRVLRVPRSLWLRRRRL